MISKTNEKENSSSSIPIHRITASMIKCYENCQKLFYYQYVANNGKGFRLSTKGIPLVFGSAFHEGIEAAYNGCDPIEMFIEKFVEDEVRDINKPVVQQKFFKNRDDGLELIKYWSENAERISNEWGISMGGASEGYFKVEWPHPEKKNSGILPIPITGRYDRITDKHQILEFKTSKKPYKQVDVDLLVQASIYNYSYFLTNGIWPTELFYIVFIKGRKNNPVQVLKTTRSKESIINTYNMISNMIAEIEEKGNQASNYSYGEGFMHNYCDCKLYEETLLL